MIDIKEYFNNNSKLRDKYFNVEGYLSDILIPVFNFFIYKTNNDRKNLVIFNSFENKYYLVQSLDGFYKEKYTYYNTFNNFNILFDKKVLNKIREIDSILSLKDIRVKKYFDVSEQWFKNLIDIKEREFGKLCGFDIYQKLDNSSFNEFLRNPFCYIKIDNIDSYEDLKFLETLSKIVKK